MCNMENAQKNAKCTWSSQDCICSIFYLTTHLLIASLKRKTDNISIILRRITTAERARAAGMLQQYVSITLLFYIGHRWLNAGVRNAWRPENDEFCLIYRKLRHLSAGNQDLSTFSGQTSCRLPAPCPSILTALVPFSVVICFMMMQNDVCFSFKWNIQQMICKIKIATNAISRAPRAVVVSEHFPPCM